MQNHLSISTIENAALNLRDGSSWQDISVNAYLMRDAAVSGRSYRVSGSVLEVLGKAHTSTFEDDTFEPTGTDEMEQLQKVSDLDSHETTFRVPKRTMLSVETQVGSLYDSDLVKSAKKTDYNTVSELLNDPDIALVLNMITGKDEPFETDMSKLDNYEISITDEDPMWGYVTYATGNDTLHKEPSRTKKRAPKQQRQTNYLRAQTHEAANQVTSPKFETAMSALSPTPSKQIIPRINNHDLQRDVSTQSTDLDPEFLAEYPHSRQSPALNQLYRNNAAYVRSYKDDGYTQAFVENMLKRKEKQL